MLGLTCGYWRKLVCAVAQYKDLMNILLQVSEDNYSGNQGALSFNLKIEIIDA